MTIIASKPQLVIFHGNCSDGMCAAWVASGVLPTTTEFRAWNYSDPPPDRSLYEDRHVLVVDFSFPRATLVEMAGHCILQVIDHHKTAAADLADLPFCTFDMKRSGAGMTWDILRGGWKRPWVIDYIEDRDLWRNALPNSTEIVAALHELPRAASGRQVTPQMFEEWDEALVAGPARAIVAGTYHMRTAQRLAGETAAKAVFAELGGHIAAVASGSVLFSDAADILCKAPMPNGQLPDLGAVFYATSDWRWTYSLRSRGDVDVSAIAKQFGGGGHAAAAGFTVKELVHKTLMGRSQAVWASDRLHQSEGEPISHASRRLDRTAARSDQ